MAVDLGDRSDSGGPPRVSSALLSVPEAGRTVCIVRRGIDIPLLLRLLLLFLFLCISSEVADCQFIDDGPVDNVVTQWNSVCVIEYGHLHLVQLQVLKLIKDGRSTANPTAAVAYAGHFVLMTFHWENQGVYDILLQTQLKPLNLTKEEKVTARRLAIRTAIPIVRRRTLLGVGSLDYYDKTPGPVNGTPGVFQSGAGLPAAFTGPVGGSPPLIADKPQAYGWLMPGPPPIPSPKYNADLKEVREYGSLNGSLRSEAQDDMVKFFNAGYSLVSVRQLCTIIAKKVLPRNISLYDTAYVLGALNAGYYDATIAMGWGKWKHFFWRPETAIRQGDSQNAPVPGWTPTQGPPVEAEYPSGFAIVAAAIKPALEDYLGTDNVTFSITTAVPRGGANLTRTFHSLSQFVQEVIDYRVFNGIHFRFSVIDGKKVGDKVARDVLQRLKADYFRKQH